MSVVRNNFVRQFRSSSLRQANATVLRFFQATKILLEHFKSKCVEVINAKTKSAEDVFFQLEGYTYIFAPERKIDADLDEKIRWKDTHEAYSKLYRENPNGNHNTDWWRRAAAEYFCSETIKRPAVRAELVVEVDSLYQKKPAEKVFSKLSKVWEYVL